MGAPSFKGSVTYASVPLEIVDRSRFDFVSVDLHRDVRIRDRFTDLLRGFFGHGRWSSSPSSVAAANSGDSKSRPR